MTHADIHSTTAGDVPALQAIVDQTGLFPSEMWPEMVAGFLTGETDDLWLSCHQDGLVVGFCYTVPEEMADGVWNMLALAIHPDHQGRGLGTALVTALEAKLRGKDQRLLIADTSGTDEFAQTRKFYARNGYQDEARIRDFWAEGDDKVTFRKTLF